MMLVLVNTTNQYISVIFIHALPLFIDLYMHACAEEILFYYTFKKKKKKPLQK